MITTEVAKECSRQATLWGEQNHIPSKWLAILAEEFGEASKNVCEYTFTKDGHAARVNLVQLREELIQVAAVAVSFVESLDRNELCRISNPIQTKLSDTYLEYEPLKSTDISQWCNPEY